MRNYRGGVLGKIALFLYSAPNANDNLLLPHCECDYEEKLHSAVHFLNTLQVMSAGVSSLSALFLILGKERL